MNVLITNRGFNCIIYLCLSLVCIWPGLITTVYHLSEVFVDLQKEDLLSLLASNDSEIPLFFSWCEMRKYKLIQTYGFSYHRHRMGFFCRFIVVI